MWQTIKSHLWIHRLPRRHKIKHLRSASVSKENRMQCARCRSEAVFFQPYSGRNLCGRHLALDIEGRAKRSIRSHRWLRSGDHLAVVVTGDRRSAALLYFLKKLTAERRDIRLSAVPVGEGVAGNGDHSSALRIAAFLGIPILDLRPEDLSGAASHGRVTRLAYAFSLDDIAEGVLAGFLSGDMDRFNRPRPAGLVPVICPFSAIPSDELDCYWDLLGTGIDLMVCPPGDDSPLQKSGILPGDYYRHHPSTKYALLHLGEQLSNGNIAELPAMYAGSAGTGEGREEMYRFLQEVTGCGS
jgi:hypothetical protein